MKTIPLPEHWKESFRQSTMRTAFELRLSQAQIEYISATADDAHWDRVRDQTRKRRNRSFGMARAAIG